MPRKPRWRSETQIDGEALVKELLNATVGDAILELERKAGSLEFEPATAEISAGGEGGRTPCGPWGVLLVLGDAGPILCCFFLEPRGAGNAA